MKISQLILTISIVLFCSVAWGYDCTHYVSTSGIATWAQATNENTPASWETAAADATAGDVACFRTGTYEFDCLAGAGQCDFNDPNFQPAHSGTSGNPIVFTNYPGETAEIYSADSVAAFGTSGQDYITYDGWYLNHSTDHGTHYTGISINSSVGVVLQNMVLEGQPAPGSNNDAIIQWGNTGENNSGGFIRNNDIFGNSGGGHNATSITTYDSDGLTIENNNIHNSSTPLHIKQATTNTIVRYNRIYNAGTDAGVILQNGIDYTDFYQNIITNSSTVGLRIMDRSNNDYNQFWNNIFYNHTYEAETFEGSGGNYHGTNNTFWNNIIQSVGSYRVKVNDGGHNDDWDYNAYYETSTYYYDGSSYSWSGWNGLGFDTHGYSGSESEQVFENAAGGDFHLIAGQRHLSTGAYPGNTQIDGGGDDVNMGAYITGNEYIGYCEDGYGECGSGTPQKTISNLTISGGGGIGIQ